MKIELIRLPRRPSWPIWAVIVVLIWLSLVGIAVYFSSFFKIDVELCLFKCITGVPCPMCGSTRGVLSIMQGNPLKAWFFNPLVFSFFLIYAISLLARVVFAKGIKLTVSVNERRFAWFSVVFLFILNWMYLIFYADRLLEVIQ